VLFTKIKGRSSTRQINLRHSLSLGEIEWLIWADSMGDGS
jgi:hypothetical protein